MRRGFVGIVALMMICLIGGCGTVDASVSIRETVISLGENNLNWKEEYQRVIWKITDYRDFTNESAFFILEDYDLDGTPELFFSVMYGARGFLDDVIVFSMQNGEMQYTSLDQSSSLGLSTIPVGYTINSESITVGDMPAENTEAKDTSVENTETGEVDRVATKLQENLWLMNLPEKPLEDSKAYDVQKFFFNRKENRCWTETVIQSGIYQYDADRELTEAEENLLNAFFADYAVVPVNNLNRLSLTQTRRNDLEITFPGTRETRALTEEDIVEFLDVEFE